MTEATGHKRKRSLQESTVDLTKMTMALQRLNSLKEELDGIEETEQEMGAVMEHVEALEEILNIAKKPVLELLKLGVTRKRLVFSSDKLDRLADGLTPKAQTEVPKLRARLLDIYAHVNMDVGHAGSRMLLDAVLLSLASIVSDGRSNVAIFPEMNIVPQDGVQILNPLSGYQVWLSGNVDYAVVQYQDESDNRDRLLGLGGTREDVFDIAEGRLFLVEAKRHVSEGSSLGAYMPEAVSQALALATLTSRKEVRFCLSNGQTWIFSLLKSEEKKWVYYESAARQLNHILVELSDKPLRQIVQLVLEWLTPSTTELYTLVN
ncbi:hypothetical protein JAAARDRAFT_134414 [Jaapia argillacea MUCL 33604]|uniref:Uncharacterized protein n=1 Tax=Jaapia argillacea MUCL 33604 TaxID=933084 RepID=A0A067PMI0_9AGAM|nr:hypothetical protein JAAARDRAFT_134414 [Jaapia argillacea MUCL 33604]